jgi:hypothetical protein
MRTPAGKECKYFYGDYYRGKNLEECRLLKDANLEWAPRLCERCPIPDILLANSCENLVYTPEVKKAFFLSKSQVEVTAYCTTTNQVVKEPRIGCGECHPALNNFVILPDDTNDTV